MARARTAGDINVRLFVVCTTHQTQFETSSELLATQRKAHRKSTLRNSTSTPTSHTYLRHICTRGLSWENLWKQPFSITVFHVTVIRIISLSYIDQMQEVCQTWVNLWDIIRWHVDHFFEIKIYLCIPVPVYGRSPLCKPLKCNPMIIRCPVLKTCVQFLCII
jgi:hypothetical protein